jgi:hypothetical protein
LIANVAVHPDYRRRGMARKMTQQAVAYARQRGSPSVWLHVREENAPAVLLYRNLGFAERARRTSWLSTMSLMPSNAPEPLAPGESIAPPPKRSWERMRTWLQRDYPPELSWHMPINIRALNPSFLGEIYRFLYAATLRQWAILSRGEVLCSLAWQPTTGHANALWLAAPDDCAPRHIQTLLAAVRQGARGRRPLALDYPARRHAQAIQSAGFRAMQTLIWMELKLDTR